MGLLLSGGNGTGVSPVIGEKEIERELLCDEPSRDTFVNSMIADCLAYYSANEPH